MKTTENLLTFNVRAINNGFIVSVNDNDFRRGESISREQFVASPGELGAFVKKAIDATQQRAQALNAPAL